MKRLLFFTLTAVCAVTFFTRNNARSVLRIHPLVLSLPVQSRLIEPRDIVFTSNGYEYRLTPLYHYEVNGLIVSKLNYRFFSMYKTARIFQVDLCMLWGSNASSGLHRDRAVRFRQDCRWCWAQWSRDIGFNLSEMSNSHLLINRPELERKVAGLVVGDQVTVKGKLVNVKARLVGSGDIYDSREITWNTSISREDGGAGACEVIYVEEVRPLVRANVLSRSLFLMSLWVLIGMSLWSVIRFFIPEKPC